MNTIGDIMGNYFSVNELLNRTWYVAEILVKDEKENILFDGKNCNTRSCKYTSMLQRYVRSVGVLDNKLVIVVI